MRTSISITLFESGDTFVQVGVEGAANSGFIRGHMESDGMRIDENRLSPEVSERISDIFNYLAEALYADAMARPQTPSRVSVTSSTGPDSQTAEVGF